MKLTEEEENNRTVRGSLLRWGGWGKAECGYAPHSKVHGWDSHAESWAGVAQAERRTKSETLRQVSKWSEPWKTHAVAAKWSKGKV